jgi:hypothetical protein
MAKGGRAVSDPPPAWLQDSEQPCSPESTPAAVREPGWIRRLAIKLKTMAVESRTPYGKW